MAAVVAVTVAGTLVERRGRARAVGGGHRAPPAARRRAWLCCSPPGAPRWLLWTGAALTLLFVVLAVFADWIAPYGFNQYHGPRRPFPPAGRARRRRTGSARRSTPRTCCPGSSTGARTSIEVVAAGAARSGLVVGVPLGLVSGYFGGWLDRGAGAVQGLRCSPSRYLLLAIVIAFLLQGSVGGGVLTAAIAITVVYIPQYFRVVRNTRAVGARGAVRRGRARPSGPGRARSSAATCSSTSSSPCRSSRRSNAADAILTLAGARRSSASAWTRRWRPSGATTSRGASPTPQAGYLVDGHVPGARDRPARHRAHAARRGPERHAQPGAAPAAFSARRLRPAGAEPRRWRAAAIPEP